MNLEAIKAVATNKFARQLFLAQKHSPQILFVAGAVGVVAATVLACRATLKVTDVLDHHEINANLIKGKYPATQEASADVTKDIRKLQLHTALDIAKLYALPAGLLVASVGALTGSHIIMTSRNATVMAAFASLDKAHREYRRRVSDEYGNDVDKKFAAGAVDVTVEEKLASGQIKKTTEVQIPTEGRFGGSQYAAMFDETSRYFTKEPGMNANFISMRQNWANDKLRAKGHLFLNDVYELLGLPETPAGAITGWIFKDKDMYPEHTGDNYVDFGVFRGDKSLVEEFIAGKYYWAVIDPNVDGLIWDKI